MNNTELEASLGWAANSQQTHPKQSKALRPHIYLFKKLFKIFFIQCILNIFFPLQIFLTPLLIQFHVLSLFPCLKKKKKNNKQHKTKMKMDKLERKKDNHLKQKKKSKQNKRLTKNGICVVLANHSWARACPGVWLLYTVHSTGEKWGSFSQQASTTTSFLVRAGTWCAPLLFSTGILSGLNPGRDPSLLLFSSPLSLKARHTFPSLHTVPQWVLPSNRLSHSVCAFFDYPWRSPLPG